MFADINVEGTTDAIVVSNDNVTGVNNNYYLRLKLFDGKEYQTICISMDKPSYSLAQILEAGMLIEVFLKRRTNPKKEDIAYFDFINFKVKKYEPFSKSEINKKTIEIETILKENLDKEYLNICITALKEVAKKGNSISKIADGFFEYSFPGGLAVHIWDLLQLSKDKFHIMLSVLCFLGAYKYYDSSYEYGIVQKSKDGNFFSKKFFTNELVAPIIYNSKLNEEEQRFLLHSINYCTMLRYCKSGEAKAFYHFNEAMKEKRKLEIIKNRCLGEESMGILAKSFNELESIESAS